MSSSTKPVLTPSPEPEMDKDGEKTPKNLKLQSRWRFWSESVTTKENWETGINDSLKEIGEFRFIQDFWSYYSSMPQLSTLKKKESFHLMKVINKEPIKPIWEDKHNENGGEWTFRIAKNEAKDCWENILLAVIGEQYDDQLVEGDMICGVTVSARPMDYVFQLWTGKANSPKLQEILTRTIEILKGYGEVKTSFYKPHKTEEKK
eukprot:gene9330-1417_t